jgi:Tfp pilus assembly protein PilF
MIPFKFRLPWYAERQFSFSLFFFPLSLLILILLAAGPVSSYDVWWHLASGRWMVAHGEILRSDPFSFTFQHKLWIDHSWLYQILLFYVYSLAGIKGIVAMRIVLVISIALVFSLTSKKMGARFPGIILAILFIASIVSPRFMDRPHLAAFLLASLLMLCLEMFRNKKRLYWALAALFVQVLWVNVHGSFVVGFLLAAVVTVREILSDLPMRQNRPGNFSIFARKVFTSPFFILCMVLVAVSVVLTPYGIEHVRFVLFSHSGHGNDATRHIMEWYRFDWRLFFFFDPLGATGQIALFFMLNAVLVYHSFVNDYFSDAVGHFLLLVVMFVLTMKHGRFSALSVIVLAPSMALAVSRCSLAIRILPHFFVILFLCHGPLYAAVRHLPLWTETARNRYPESAIHFIERHNLTGKILNTYGYGGFLEFHLFPGSQVAIDGRTPTLFPPEFYWYFRQASDNRKALENFLEEYPPDMILMDIRDGMNKMLFSMPGWAMVFAGNRAALFMPVEQAQKYSLPVCRIYRPWDDIADYVDDLNATTTLSLGNELRNLLVEDKGNYRVLRDMGIFYARAKQDFGNAIAFYERAIDIYPLGKETYYDAVLAYEKTDSWKEALEWSEKGLRWFPSAPDLMLHKGYALVHLARYSEAVEYFRFYIDKKQDEAEYDFYKYFAVALYRSGNAEEALLNFRKAARLLRGEPDEQAVISYNIATCHVCLGQYVLALKSLKRAMLLDPDNTLYQDYFKKMQSVLP